MCVLPGLYINTVKQTLDSAGQLLSGVMATQDSDTVTLSFLKVKVIVTAASNMSYVTFEMDDELKGKVTGKNILFDIEYHIYFGNEKDGLYP